MKKSGKPDHIARKDWDSVDSPALTGEQLAAMRPAQEVMPDVVKAYKRRTRGPGKATPKTRITIRLDSDILEHFKSTGRGWQTRLNDTLAEYLRKKSA